MADQFGGVPIQQPAPVGQFGGIPVAANGAPQSNALSDAYRQAFLAGDTVTAHKIAVQARQQGVPIAPISDADINGSVDQRFAQSVQDEGTAQKMLEGAGKSFADTGQGLGQLVGLTNAQDVAESRRLGRPLMATGAAKLGYGLGTAAQVAGTMATGGIAGAGLRGAGLLGESAAVGGNALGRLGALAAAGGAQGYVAPYATGGEHVSNTVGGILAGPALVGAGRVIGKMATGAATPEARELIDAGVKLTPGQMLGGVGRRIEDALTSVPFLGDAIRNAQRRSVATFNTAAMNRALEPIGEKLPPGVAAGHDAINAGVDATRKAYSAALDGTVTKADQPLMSSIAAQLNALPARVQSKVVDVLESRVFPAINESGGKLSGQQFKDMTSGVLGDMRAMGRSTDPIERNASNALGGMLGDFQNAFARSNGEGTAARLAAADKAYRGFMNLQDAASHGSQGSGGVFTPAQFSAAVRRGDASKGKAAFARGNAYMQDLSGAAGSVLPRTVPDSGTPLRWLLGTGLLAGAGEMGAVPHVALPAATAMAAGSLPYTRAGGRVAQALIAPEVGPVRNAIGSLAARAPAPTTPALWGIQRYLGAQQPTTPLLVAPEQ